MCFSATASFTTSGVLMVVGVASVSRISRTGQLLLASSPIIFSIQQFTEGMLWLNPKHKIFAHVFVVIAHAVWPVWVPLADLLLEKDVIRRRILMGLLTLGFCMSTYLLFLSYVNPVTVVPGDHHLKYVFHYPEFVNSLNLIYLIPTVFSHFVSSIKSIQYLGYLTLLSFIISKMLYFNYVFSVWCFFAAIISIFVFLIINSMAPKEMEQCSIP